MNTAALRSRKSALAIAATLALGAWPAQEAQALSCVWNPATGNWSTASDWSCPGPSVPGAADVASIASGKVVTINSAQSIASLTNAGGVNIDAFLLTLGGGSTSNTGTINVGAGPIPNNAALQISGGHNITNTGGVINISADSVVNQFGSAITGGTINSTGTGRLVAFNNNNNILSGVTLNGTLDLASGTGVERVVGGLTLNGSINVNSNSVLSFAGSQTLGGMGTIVLGNTGASNRALSIEGDTALTIGSNVVVRGENGTIGGAYLAGGAQSLINNGRISADVAGGRLDLSPSSGTTNNGILEAKNGGTLVLNTNVIGSPSGSIVAGAGSTVVQNGVTLSGIINTAGTGDFRAANSNSNFLSGVTFNGTLDLATGSSVERVINGLTLNGSVNVNANSVLSFAGSQTLGGTGTIVLGNTGGSNRALSMEGDTVLTIGPNVVVRGENGTIGQAYLAGGAQSLINNGRISADVAGGRLDLSPSSGTTNNGILEAKNGGTLVLNTSVTGAVGSHIDAGAGSTVVQNGVSLNGVINSAGGGSFLVANNNNNFLNGVTFNGTLDLAAGTSVERVTGGLTLNGSINVNSNSVLSFAGSQTLGGMGTIVLGNTGASNRALSMEGNMVLTIGPNIVVRGENGTIGLVYLAGGAQSLVNNGRISADVAGGRLDLSPSSGTTNNGVLEAKNGGTLVLNTNVIGSPSGTIVAGAGSTVVQNGVTLSGIINTAGTGNFRAANSNSNFLSGATFNGPLDLASGTSVERVINGLTLNGSINVNANSVLSFAGDQTLAGNGTIVLGNTGGSNRALAMEGSMVLTVGPNIVVRGENGTVGGAYLAGGNQTLVNNGSIQADVNGGLIDLNAVQTNNAATLSAMNGGTLRLNGNVTNVGSGHIDAGTGSNVIQNGFTVSGGSINTTGTGTFTPTNNNNNFFSNVTIAGLVNLATGTGIERVVNGLTLSGGGSVSVNSNSVLSFNGDQTLGGSGSIVLGATGASNRALSLEGDTTLTVGSNVLVHGINGTLGQAYLAGGTQSLVNNGTINSDGGGLITVAPASALTNNGTMRAQSGTLVIAHGLTGTGNLQVDAAGVMNLSNVANVQGKLVMGAAGAVLNIGTQNLTINNDYTNLAAGTGNAFNKRAGISGAGLVVAGGDAAQAITGANVSNGNTANATLTINNVRVGATTYNYQVANTGTTGPSLRGAMQTNVNGASLSDARLSGAGVAASNYNTGAPGSNSGDLGVVFTVASAGALAPLVNQKLNLTSNFSNIADQKLNIVLGAGAAAYNAAAGAATPSPATVANQRVNGSNSAALTVANTAAAGAFSEDLNATFGASTGAASGTGSISGRLAGSNNTGSGSMTVAVDTTTSGAKTGTVTLNYETAGKVAGLSNGLGTASAGSQLVTVTGNVYQAATGAIQTAPLNFGTLQVGQTFDQALVVKNAATGAIGFIEDLHASFGSSSGVGASQISGLGAFNGITAGSNSNAGNGTMTVRVTGMVAGAINGAMGVNYQTAGAVGGVSNSLGTAPAGSQDYGVQGVITAAGNVINQANPVINTPVINLGAVRVGAAALTSQVSVTNQASAPPQAALTASGIVSNGAPFTASGSFSLLAPGGTDNASLVVGMNTGTAGNFTGGNAGTATISFVSDASNVGGCSPNCQMALAPQNVTLAGKVYSVAAGQLVTSNVDFGVVRVGDVVASRNINVNNTAATSALSDTLRADLSGVGGPFTSSGSVSGIAAQSGGAIGVGLNTATAGVFNQNGTVAFKSHNADMADISAGPDGAVTVVAQINNLANADFDKLVGMGVLTQNGSDYVLDFGDVVLGSVLSSLLQLDNDVAGPADDLSGGFNQAAADEFTLGGWNPFSLLAAGQATAGMSIDYLASHLGLVTDEVVFNGVGTNASDPNGLAQSRHLLIRANVIDPNGNPIPEPGSLALILAAAVAGAIARRRACRNTSRNTSHSASARQATLN